MIFTKKNFVIVLYFLALAYFLATVYGLYFDMAIFKWVDTPLHFLGGFVASFFFATYYAERLRNIYKEKTIYPRLFILLFILGAATSVGVAWEVYEFAYDKLIAIPQSNFLTQPSLDDTMKDLIMDTAGGLEVALLFFLTKGK